jgi:hypothetical protein
MRILAALPLALVMMTTIGCSVPTAAPTEEVAKKFYLEERKFLNAPPTVDGMHSEFVSFKKTDGQWGEKDGGKFYRLAYDAQYISKGPRDQMTVNETGWIRFERSENGWHASSEQR